MDVSIRQLESFVAVADLGSFTKAAALLHISQPALSRQIGGLEHTLGSQLFDRRPHPVLTPRGRELLASARAVLDAVTDLERHTIDLDTDQVGQLRVGVIHSLTVGVIPPLLQDWHAEHPRIELHLEEFSHSNELAAAMKAAQLDVAIGPRPPGWPGITVPLFVERFVVAMSPAHPLATSTTPLPLGDTAPHPWIHYHPTHGLHDLLDRTCEHAGFTPRVSVRLRQTAVAPTLAEAGAGLAFVPDNAIPAGFGGHVRPITPKVERAIVAYGGRTIDPLAQHLITTLRRQRTLTGRPRNR